MPEFPCRACGAPVSQSVVDLGEQPLANSYRSAEDDPAAEPRYPLHPHVCESCWLVQLPEVATPDEIFSDYAYFSSFSDSWLAHARAYADQIVDKLGLDAESHLVEVASNDGYLLRRFVERGIPAIGIEPAQNVAAEAERQGVPTERFFLGAETARGFVAKHGQADLVVANNVMAHVPDLNDFIAGLALLVADTGTLTIEVPHLLRLVEETEFDTIYHEHFSYFSLLTARDVLSRHGLTVVDCEELPSHGGSLRIYARHGGSPSERVAEIEARERAGGLTDLEGYASFRDRVAAVRRDLLTFLETARGEGRSVAAYGAPAKGNTLLNYCGVGTDLIAYTVDRSPHKQGHLLPGSGLPIDPPDRIFETRPDYVLILPWNLAREITVQMAAIAEWGGRFVVPIPMVQVLAAPVG
ncbi:MAG: class I SAM-dependent methyltransferase [Actinobacteria bacterium]|nr:class I SAM-dependent methyltransferase [Actinomycetota bacterium]